MEKLILSLLAIGFAFTINAQSKKKQDQEAIKGMCGCFEVTFNFAETFNYSEDPDYKPSKNKISKGLEWAQLAEDEKNKVSIQHLLIVGPPDGQMVIKHWRQDWLYQNTDFYMYNGYNVWNYENKSKGDVKKQWTQKVFQVDDSPRYESSGSWVHMDGKSYWESTTPAPLPRREYTQRSDYNITIRGNRQEITDFGWVHDQDNEKVIRKEGSDDVVVAKEKGYNVYKKVDDSKCKVAQNWWQKYYDKWKVVRSKWDEVYGRNTTLKLEKKVDNKVLYRHLFAKGMTDKADIEKIIEAFVMK
tara:strand:+ start:646 stop:1548 length:903 start_codon:yes stop_codon:yes gene_type:complete